MTSIDPISSAQVVSYYTRTVSSGDTTVVSRIQYVEDRGTVRVEEIKYTTYDRSGNQQTTNPVGSILDITV